MLSKLRPIATLLWLCALPAFAHKLPTIIYQSFIIKTVYCMSLGHFGLLALYGVVHATTPSNSAIYIIIKAIIS